MTFPDNDQTCHVCANRGVNTWHILRCEARRAEDQSVAGQAAAAGVPTVKAYDLLAHIRSGRLDDPAAIVAVVLDLGWRPVVGALADAWEAGRCAAGRGIKNNPYAQEES